MQFKGLKVAQKNKGKIPLLQNVHDHAFSGTSSSRVHGRWIKVSNINRVKYLEGSGVAVKKWMQGRLVSLGRMDTMLPVVQNPPESMQIPLALSLSIDIMTSAVTAPEPAQRAERVG